MKEKNLYPLSPMQQGMLFHYLSDQYSGVDIEQMVCTLLEDLKVSAFEQAWQYALEVHPTLRSSFRWKDATEPLQEVHKQVDIPFASHDWRGLSQTEHQQRLEEFLKRDRRQGFDFEDAPLMRLTLFYLGEADYRLVWTFHHIIADGRSHPIILKDVFSAYEAICQDRDVQLKRSHPYRDHIAWLQKQDFSDSDTFWQQMLRGFTAPTPVGVPRSTNILSENRSGGAEYEIHVSKSTTSSLQKLARRNQLTLNNMVQGAWALLLSRYSGEEDVVFGVTRACRRSTVKGAEDMVGLFINTLPIRTRVLPANALIPWLKELRAQQIAIRDHEHTPLVRVQAMSEVTRGTPLFDSIIVFDNYKLSSKMQAQGGSWKNREFRLLEQTSFPISLYGYGGSELLLKIIYDQSRYESASIKRMLAHLRTLLKGMAANLTCNLSDLTVLTKTERRQILAEWNDTEEGVPSEKCIHQLFEDQVERTPETVAIVFEDQQLSYQELNHRANQLARHLSAIGVGPEVLVGICIERSLDMVIGLLGILKAGGAYIPLDPKYPKERLAFMLKDSKAAVLLTKRNLARRLPDHQAEVVLLDDGWKVISGESDENFDSGVKDLNLAYVIYTSGSTGKPKGVMVNHSNVINFFVGMDERIGDESPGVWLAVTSISFDISVLELFWTLTRGFKVVLIADVDKALSSSVTPGSPLAGNNIDFSLFYWDIASEKNGGVTSKYKLLLEGARFADKNGFSAVWTPERHFHAFGGLYPNPSVTSAALAAITNRIKIRAGSVVLPLHNPIRVAEEWALVDNLSEGRIGISFASGWHANDFVFAPENYTNRKEIMFEQINTVRKLWCGESVSFQAPESQSIKVKTLPRPIQPELPIWITAAGNPETYRMAGEMGANLLTHLLGQRIEELSEKLAIYRKAWKANGNDPGRGHVTLMLHTFVGEDNDMVKEIVRQPMKNYLRTAMALVMKNAWQFPVVARQVEINRKDLDEVMKSLTEDEIDALLDHAFERYYETSGLFGTPDICLEMVNKLKAIRVDEIACLIDFGFDFASVMSSLKLLNEVRERSTPSLSVGGYDTSLPALIRQHHVTHMQCTPSLIRVLISDPRSFESLRSLKKLMLGGEALPSSLVEQLSTIVSGEIHNMYGPTETTIWSTTHLVDKDDRVDNSISIGRPIANTEVYILDRNMQPVPVGVPGELLIGGKGVVRGYLNRPELTKGKFIPNPFKHKANGYLYRTGDLVRYLPDGKIEFLGRLDYQVKIRGYRIELGEVEAALEQHPAVREAVIITRDDIFDDSQLVAFLTAKSESPPLVSELRNFLKEKLPDFMVPSAFVFLEALPLTPNGKINRRALLIPESVRPELEKEYKTPHSSTEKSLAKLWSEVLGIDKVGKNDNFFDLGGHSLSAVQTTNRIRQIFNVELPLQSFIESSTLADMAVKVEETLLDQVKETNFEVVVP